MLQIEKALQQEVLLRLRRYPVVPVVVPNSIYFPARTEAERRIISRVVAQMKNDGMLTPGAPDLILISAKGGICLELKRGRTADLFGSKPAGRLSSTQREFKRQCDGVGVRYVVAQNWEHVEAELQGII